MTDLRQTSPAVARNREPLLEVLRRTLPAAGELLELAAGTGEHSVYFAPRFPGLGWQPADRDPDALASIAAWGQAEPSPNLRRPIALDVEVQPWPVSQLTRGSCGNFRGARARREAHVRSKICPWSGSQGGSQFDVILCVNMIHASPWETTVALMAGAARVLRPGGRMVLYGAYRVAGVITDSNVAFDGWLKQRDPRWGVRDLEQVVQEAERNGFALVEHVAMPANNLVVVLDRP